MGKAYYSVRSGKHPGQMSLNALKRLFLDTFKGLDASGCLQEYFGYECVDMGHVSGKLGRDVEIAILKVLKKDNLWPVEKRIEYYSEDDLFDVIEFVFDHVSYPIEQNGDYHSHMGCGYHYKVFDKSYVQDGLAGELNEYLCDYSMGFYLDGKTGQILRKEDPGLDNLLNAGIPKTTDEDVRGKILFAIEKYQKSRSSIEERRVAIRELADVFENLRNHAKVLFAKQDETDLFNLLNNFAVRHDNRVQKKDYDQDVWYSWIFYHLLAGIHTLLRLIEKKRLESEK